ncbi:YusW family protein [Lysinibacillus antri]|uniref:YusW-like protein n=1 Tax=Lysinibacillus antri TaxID=2498145 RepID=A0A432LB18_9BACI|nr:YusW family protein [Lysinibacillus antri]RUL51740.1 hypothetical protein EK386_11545 [Lysinibacillus antri]
MKYAKILIVPFLVGALYGCNDNDVDQDELVTETNPATETNQTDTTNDDQENAETSYNFTHFDLDVDYANDVSYDVEYTMNQNGTTAEIDDDANKVELKGDEANNQLAGYFESLTFNETSSDEDVVNQVITAFKLDENYQNLKLEVKFNNGDVKRYEFKK